MQTPRVCYSSSVTTPMALASVIKRLFAIGGMTESDGKMLEIEAALTANLLSGLISWRFVIESALSELDVIVRGAIKQAVNAEDEDRVIKLLDLFNLLFCHDKRLLISTFEHYLAGTDSETGLPVYGTARYKDTSGVSTNRTFIKSRLWLLGQIAEHWIPEQSALSIHALGLLVGSYGHYASLPYDKFRNETLFIEHLNIFPCPPDNSGAREVWTRGIKDLFRRRLDAPVWTSVEIGKWLDTFHDDITQELLRMMVAAWVKKEINFQELIPAIVQTARTSRPGA
ncbi:MAG: hypothetical protein HZA95_01935 [Candidatus Vogelbacteria bacterium]|nr:hypothetical protein [Candidatus Vogelbacteria bacterium]